MRGFGVRRAGHPSSPLGPAEVYKVRMVVLLSIKAGQRAEELTMFNPHEITVRCRIRAGKEASET